LKKSYECYLEVAGHVLEMSLLLKHSLIHICNSFLFKFVISIYCINAASVLDSSDLTKIINCGILSNPMHISNQKIKENSIYIAIYSDNSLLISILPINCIAHAWNCPVVSAKVVEPPSVPIVPPSEVPSSSSTWDWDLREKFRSSTSPIVNSKSSSSTF
jgi:hypothetical protein